MKWLFAIFFVLVALAGIGAGVFLYETAPDLPRGPIATTHESEQDFDEIARGRYLVTVADCAACHTDPNGGEPFAGGRGIETPFGMVVAPNITPDRETGIGAWTDTDFADALRKGFGKDGHMLYPAMPYPYYTRLSHADVDAIHAYMRTVAPVKNEVVPDQLPFPLDIRLGMRAWNVLYFREGRYKPDPGRSAQWNRGAYLVLGAEHCGACHTPKTLLGGDKASAAFQGATIQGWFAPNITNDERRGLGKWSVEDVVRYLESGHVAHAAASGPMAEEVDHSSSRMPKDDLEAIAVYLKSLPGQDDDAKPVDAGDPAMQAGEAIYRDSCAACHRIDGSGIPTLFPALKGSSGVQSREPTSLVRVVLDGAKSVATDKAPTGPAMPSYGWQLQDAQVAAVLTYIRNAWGNQAPAVSASSVASSRLMLDRRAN